MSTSQEARIVYEGELGLQIEIELLVDSKDALSSSQQKLPHNGRWRTLANKVLNDLGYSPYKWKCVDIRVGALSDGPNCYAGRAFYRQYQFSYEAVKIDSQTPSE